MIPAEAVEAAEEAVFAALLSRGLEGQISGYEQIARAALEAAAPYMLAGVRSELVTYQEMLLQQSSEAEVFGFHATGVGVAIGLLDEAAAPHMLGAANGAAPRKGPLVVPVPRSAVTNLYRTSKAPTKPDQPGGIASE